MQTSSCIETFALPNGQVLRFEGAEIELVSGMIWLTSEGRREDIVLRAGDRLSTAELCNVVLQALRPSQFKYCRAQRAS